MPSSEKLFVPWMGFRAPRSTHCPTPSAEFPPSTAPFPELLLFIVCIFHSASTLPEQPCSLDCVPFPASPLVLKHSGITSSRLLGSPLISRSPPIPSWSLLSFRAGSPFQDRPATSESRTQVKEHRMGHSAHLLRISSRALVCGDFDGFPGHHSLPLSS